MNIVHISDTPGPGTKSLNPHDDAEFELVWTEIKEFGGEFDPRGSQKTFK